MKKRNVFAIAIASLALALGVGAGLKANRVQEAKAISAGETIYVDVSNDWKGQLSASVSVWMHCWNTASDATDVEFSNVSGNLYSATLPSACNNIIFYRSQATTPVNWWDQSDDLVLSNILNNGNNVVKQKSDSWKFVADGAEEYRPEKTSGAAYLRGSWSGGWADFSHEMTVDGNVCSINNVLLSAGEQIKVIKIDSYKFVQWYEAASLSGNSGATFVSPNVTINTTGRYNISVNTSTKAYTVNVYEDVDLNAAISFCDDFKTSMSKYCPVAGSEDNKGTSKLQSEWSDFATRFAGLTLTAQGYLEEGENSSVEKITEFAERYDSIIGDYRTLLSSYDFLNRLSNPSNVINDYTPNNNNAIIIITISSVLGLTAIGCLFLLKRKKEN